MFQTKIKKDRDLFCALSIHSKLALVSLPVKNWEGS
uniref:Uncharacterized protein n=1 Tax=Arundo donax TaxID=35708 RepID=A0A0A8ZJ67_ARUDO